jgi:hypothetical protein
MASPRESVKPRTYFLNETHELSPQDKTGGGRTPDYVGISWAKKAQRISSSISQVMEVVQSSHDPLRDERFFVLAQPVPELEKRSKDKRKAPKGTFKDPTSFGDAHGRVFDRLGLDLLQVTDDGKAVVHGGRERIEQLQLRSKALQSLGAREQARWATIDMFEAIPLQLRVDSDWLRSLRPHEPSDVIIELQPILGRVEADQVLRAIADLLARSDGERLTGTGTDFSGRFWFRGQATQRSVRSVAKDFYSVQAIHSPLYSMAAATGKLTKARIVVQGSNPPNPVDARALPTVAVVDLGVPPDHLQLAPYRRGQFVPQDAAVNAIGDHGSFVASRIVFGDCGSDVELSAQTGECSFYDAMVGDIPTGAGDVDRVNDKVVMDAIAGVRGAAPDVRVFNLSLGDVRPLAQFAEIERREKRTLLQDLDNFVFANDAIVVVAAGNSRPGVVPSHAYPNHHEDPQWALGPWACGYNTLVCGSYVSGVSASGIVRTVGWPSPFSRIGPGVSGAPVPSFAAPGGNANLGYRSGPGLGVWGLNAAGMAEDRSGTSHAAPILAREAAKTVDLLKGYCAPGTQPFGVLVRAYLALVAEKTTEDTNVSVLTERTLGFGRAESRRLSSPKAGTAVVIWQGVIETPKDVVRVQLPVPKAWLALAADPVLRLVICSDPPVNESAKTVWACRKVRAVLHTGPDAPAVRAPLGAHESYPLLLREYSLARYKPGTEREADDDMWVLECSYDDVFAYPPAMDFDPRQRVAFAAELVDRGATGADPQQSMQQLPAAATMNRLSAPATMLRNPVLVRTRRS